MVCAYGQILGVAPPHYAAEATRKVAVRTVSATAGAASTAAALATAAGLSAIPVAGWIAAAGIGITAGTIQLVIAIREGKARKAEAVQRAQELGIPDAAMVPGYTVKALEASPAWREKQVKKLLKRYQTQRFNRWRTRAKLQILGAVAKVDAAAQDIGAAPPAPSVDISPIDPDPDMTPLLVGAGLVIALTAGVLMYGGSPHE